MLIYTQKGDSEVVVLSDAYAVKEEGLFYEVKAQKCKRDSADGVNTGQNASELEQEEALDEGADETLYDISYKFSLELLNCPADAKKRAKFVKKTIVEFVTEHIIDPMKEDPDASEEVTEIKKKVQEWFMTEKEKIKDMDLYFVEGKPFMSPLVLAHFEDGEECPTFFFFKDSLDKVKV